MGENDLYYRRYDANLSVRATREGANVRVRAERFRFMLEPDGMPISAVTEVVMPLSAWPMGADADAMASRDALAAHVAAACVQTARDARLAAGTAGAEIVGE